MFFLVIGAIQIRDDDDDINAYVVHFEMYMYIKYFSH